MAGQVQKDANGDPVAVFMALESVLRSIVKDMGSPKGIGQFARFLRDHPDKFPMFSTVPDKVPSRPHLCSCKATLRRFSCEKREAGHTPSAIFGAFMNMYLYMGSQAIGALNLADRIENWDPEHQAKLRQVGLRSSFELDDEEGHVFIALSADRYPIGVMGRRNALGELFVSRIVASPHDDFAAAVDDIKQSGVDLILGSEAKELLCKMEQVKGVALRADKIKEIWEVENWGHDEWAEQVLAEIAFAKAMNVQYFLRCDKLQGSCCGLSGAPRSERFGAGPFGQRRGHLCGGEGGDNKKRGLRPGLVAWIGGEAFTVLSEELLGHSPRGLARYGKAPRQGTAPGNASI